ncbi:MAG: ABC transporter substrate-binding protein [Parabacteroides sp.]
MKPTQILAIVAVVALISVGCYFLYDNTTNTNSGDITITQYDGEVVTFDKLPEHIVCLSTYAAEVIVLLGETDHVVGVCHSIVTNAELSDYYKNATDVGSFSSPTAELIIATTPDVVITYSTSNDVVEALLSGTNIKCVALDCGNTNKICSDVKSIGILVNQTSIANKFCEYYTDIINQVKAAAEGKDKPTLYMEGFSNYSVYAPTSAYQTMAILAGANLCYTPTSSTTISAESLLEKNPDFIIKTPTKKTMTSTGTDNIYEELMTRSGLSSLDAIENGNVWIICSQCFGGPRAFAGALACSIIFFGELESGITVESALTEYNELFNVNFNIDDLIYPSISN